MNINDIITESQQKCPHCGGPLMEYSDLMEKKDACYYKVKASAKVWPSAYASGRLVQCRKKGAGNYGNKSESVSEGVAETVSMDQAKKVLGHYGADHFKTTTNELHFYKNGRPMSVDLIFNYDDATRSVSLRQLNSMIRGLKGQGLPAADTTIKVDGIPVKITRAGKNDSYIGYSWTTEDGKEHYEETSVNDHSNLRSLANAISDEIEQSQKQGIAEDKGMTQYNAFKREWRAKHGSDAKVPGYDSKEYNAYWWRQGDKQQDNKKQGVSEQQLDEKCWDGYQQQGMKNKSGRQVPNCVPVTEELTTEQQFDMIEDMVEHLAESHGVDPDVIWEDFESVDDHELYETAAWRRKEGKSARGGLNAKGVASYRRENPGSKLQTAVTTKPSKLKPGSKAAKRRKSFCARMGGVKGPMKKPNGKPTRKALALRKWNC